MRIYSNESQVDVRLLGVLSLLCIFWGALVLWAADYDADLLDDDWETSHGLSTNAVAADALVGWWQLDETSGATASDRSTNNLALTVINAGSNDWQPGAFNHSLQLDGTARYLQAQTNAAYNLDNFTVSAWVNTGANTTLPQVIAHWADANGDGWEMEIDNDGRASVWFTTTGAANQFLVSTNSPAYRVDDSAWHHIAMSYESTNSFAKLYVDGQLEAEGNVTGTLGTNATSFAFGQPSTTNSAFFAGSMDEVRLYSRVLSDAEVSKLPETYSDADGDGLNTLEEQTAGTNPTLADTDGDGIPDGTDGLPLDFYNGQAPTITLVQGNEQQVPPDIFAPDALTVAIADGVGNPLAGAPVHFEVISGGGLLSEPQSNGEMPADFASATKSSQMEVSTGANNQSGNEAAVYLASASGASKTLIRVTAGSSTTDYYLYTALNDDVPLGKLEMWLRANDVTGIGNGGRVSTWSDKSGTGRKAYQYDAGWMQPTYQGSGLNGQPSVYFNGDQGYHLSSIDGFDQGVTVIAVTKPVENHFRAVLDLGMGSATQNVQFITGGFDSDTVRLRMFGNGSGELRQASAEGAFTNGKAHVIAALDDGTSSGKIFVDGVLRGESDTALAVSGDVRTQSRLGSYGHANSGGYNGYVSEVLIYSRKLSENELQQVHAYLQAKYSLELGDSDLDGMPDSFEQRLIEDAQYQGVTGSESWTVANVSPTADADGDAADNQAEYAAGTDPTGFYDTHDTAQLTLLSGGSQTTAINGISSQPLKVKVEEGGSPLANAPVVFEITGGDAGILFPASGGGAPADASGAGAARIVRTDANGEAWVYLAAYSEREMAQIRISLAPNDYVETNHFTIESDAIPGDGLQFWLRADEFTGYADDTRIDRWKDQSGNGRSAWQYDDGWRKPTYESTGLNGLPALYFSGEQAYYMSDIGGFDQGASIFVVTQPVDDHYGMILDLGLGDYQHNLRLRTGHHDNNQVTWHAVGSSGSEVRQTYSRGRLTPGAGRLVSVVDDGASTSSLYLNGVKESEVNTALSLSGDARTQSQIGAFGHSGNGGYHGYISEILIYNRSLNEDEVHQVHAYLAAKYSLAIGDADFDGMADVFEARLIEDARKQEISGSENWTVSDILPGDDADSDSVSNRQEYEAGSDPVGYYDAHSTATLTLLSGGSQTTSPGELAKMPLKVKVEENGSPLANAPVSFEILAGVGGICLPDSNGDAPADTTGTGNLQIARTDANGEVWVYLASPAQRDHGQVKVSLAPSNSIIVHNYTMVVSGPPSTGLQLWLRADDAKQEYAARVWGWNDQSGHGHVTWSELGYRCPDKNNDVFNGHDTLNFDGYQDFHYLTDGNGGRPESFQDLTNGVTMVVVTKPSGQLDSNKNAFILDFGEGYGLDNLRLIARDSDGADANNDLSLHWEVLGGANGDTLRASLTDTLPVSTYQVITALDNGQNVNELYLDGALLDEDNTEAGIRDTDRTLNAISGRGDNPNYNYKGEVAEILVYNRPLDSEELVQLHDYLESKYALTIDTDDDDFDKLPDDWELAQDGVSSLDDLKGANGDFDQDGLTDLAEFLAGTSVVNADTDGDQLPDGWEVDFNYDPLASDSVDLDSDTDGDGLNFLQEANLGTDPNLADTDNDGTNDGIGVPGFVRMEFFDRPSPANTSADQILLMERYPSAPDHNIYASGGFVIPDEFRNPYQGARVRGYLTPEVTGDYVFWLDGYQRMKLFLSEDGKSYKKKLVAFTVQDGGGFDSGQNGKNSEPIHLEAGQKYYIELRQNTSSHYSDFMVAWTPPGAEREIIPAEFLSVFVDEDDADDDRLEDAWEISHFGSIEAAEANGDPDGDLVANYFEQKSGTDPNLADTDSNGNSDLHDGMGAMTVGYWFDRSGVNIDSFVASAEYPDSPDLWKLKEDSISNFVPAKNHVAVELGYVVPDESGSYEFKVDGRAPTVRVWLSSDEAPANKQLILSSKGNLSSPVNLVAGQKYYLEAAYNIGSAGSNSYPLTYAWRLNGGNEESLSTDNIRPYPVTALAASNLPAGWISADVHKDHGEDHFKGVTKYDAQEDVWTLYGRGSGFGGYGDSFHFVHQEFSTYEQAKVRLNSFDAGNGNKMSGLMVRESLDPNSKFIAFRVWGDGSIELISRDDSDSSTTLSGDTLSHAPVWLRFDRNGNSYTALTSLDGHNWNVLGVVELDLGSNPLVGMAACNVSMGTSYVYSEFEQFRLDSDSDGDGIADADETALGTNPNLADSDGDGYSDYDELYVYSSDPLMPDLVAATTVVTATGSSATIGLGQWQTDGDSIYSQSVKGKLSYTINVPEDGVYRLELEAEAYDNYTLEDVYTIRFLIDGQFVDRVNLYLPEEQVGLAQVATPWLAAGNHTVTVEYENTLSYRQIKINALRLQTLGEDADENGIEDWVEQRLAAYNSIEAVTSSYVSPVCLEGKSRYLEFAELSDGTTDYDPLPAPAASWYANIPLSDTSATAIAASLENGGVEETLNVTWQAFNTLEPPAVNDPDLVFNEDDEVLLRKDDALLLKAELTGVSSGSTTLTITHVPSGSGSQLTPSPINLGATDTEAFTFSEPGTYTLAASHDDGGGTITNVSTTVEVLEGAFNGNPIYAGLGLFRNWDNPMITNQMLLEVDDSLNVKFVKNISGGGVQLKVRCNRPEEGVIIARLDEDAPILAHSVVDPLTVASNEDTTVDLLETYADGSQLIGTAIILNSVPEDIEVKLTMFVGGVTFDDGTTVKYLHAEDFDEYGRAYIKFIMGANINTSNCHTIRVTVDGVFLGNF